MSPQAVAAQFEEDQVQEFLRDILVVRNIACLGEEIFILRTRQHQKRLDRVFRLLRQHETARKVPRSSRDFTGPVQAELLQIRAEGGPDQAGGARLTGDSE